VVLGLVLEHFYKNGIGLAVSAKLGFLSLIVAHNLSVDGDTMIMLQAVLDTNFWLATHVVMMALGYASTFVAGFLAIIYILMGIFTRNLTNPTGKASVEVPGTPAETLKKDCRRASTTNEAPAAQRGEMGKSLTRMVYAIICFATLFSFVGTVLGGIWADHSWGRFWGWDPKENGALMIVLWNALVLHLRWGGMARERGLINCAIIGNIVTSWSWFGVNMLGIGLHSYGFMSGAFKWLALFVGSQLLLIGLGSLPLKYWKSFREQSQVTQTYRKEYRENAAT
jgi:ABC-type transport system involved in cytochrome c biogenesis permease subunit